MKYPDFLCIGAQKSGTTWIDSLLRGSQQVFLPERRKEVHYFDRYFGRGPEWYGEIFSHCSDELICGECTPAYLHHPECPARVAAVCPNVKLIVSLRDPAARAWSHYLMLRSKRWSSAGFWAAVEKYPSIVDIGHYSRWLGEYLRYFDLENMFFLDFERIKLEPKAVSDELCEFLEIDVLPDYLVNSEAVNASADYSNALVSRSIYSAAGFLRSLGLDDQIDLMRPVVKRVLSRVKTSQGESKVPDYCEKADVMSSLRDLYSEELEKLKSMVDFEPVSGWG